jgi:hypothetical protein
MLEVPVNSRMAGTSELTIMVSKGLQMYWCKYIVCLLMVCLLCNNTMGAYCSWLGGAAGDPNNWIVADNWACGSVPNGTYTANISLNGSAPAITGNAGIAQGIYMAPSSAGYSVSLTVDGGSISILQNISVGTVGSGSATITVKNGGSITATDAGYGNLYLNGSGQSSLVIISGTVEARVLTLSAGHSISIGSGNLVLQGDVTGQINGYIQGGLISAYGGQGSLVAIYDSGKTYVNQQGIPLGQQYLFADIDGDELVDMSDLALFSSQWLMDINGSQTRMPWIDAQMYNSGALNDNTIRMAVGGIGGVKRTLLLGAGIWQINSPLIVPSNINLKFEQGAVLNVSGANTVAINGSLEASISQIFSGTGKVSLNSLIKEAYPQWWGTPGTADDTAMCRAVLDSGAKNIRFLPAVYNIDADGDGDQMAGLQPPSDVNVVFDKGSKLKAIPNSSTNYSVINISGKSNITLSGATIEGDRHYHTGTAGEWGMGILITGGSTNIFVKDVNSYDCWGDGIYINGVSNGITVENSTFDHNRRNGCSIISAKNVLFTNCLFSNTDGTSPYKGVDIEPNYSTDVLQNIVFENCRSYKNLTKGFSPAFDGSLNNPVSIVFSNCSSESDGMGFSLDAGPRDTVGTVTFRDCTSTNAREAGFGCFSANIYTIIDGLHIINPNQGNSSQGQFASGIVLWIDSSRSNLWCGNIHASNVDVQSTDGKAKYALYFSNDATGGTTYFRDIDIQMTTNMSNVKRLYKGAGLYSGYCTILFTDNPVYGSTVSISSANMFKYISQKLTNQGASVPVVFSVNSSQAASFDSVYSIDVLNANGITLNFSGYNLMPGNLSSYGSNQVGSHLKIRSDGVNWSIVESIGTWQ